MGERLSSSSESGRSPAAKRVFVHLLSEDEVWEALKLSQRVRAEPDRQNLHFNLMIKSPGDDGL
jgi:hypothetical protein